MRIGSIGTEPAEEVSKFLPLANYLAKELAPEGISQGLVVVARDIPEMGAFLRERKIDLYIDSPFPSLAVSQLAGARLLLRRWKKGMPEYHSVIFARRDSGIRGLEDLRGRVVAFEEPFSSSGYFLPKVALRQARIRAAALRDVTDPVGQGDVGYVFSWDDENTLVWVARGKVAAGAMDDQTYLREVRGYGLVLTVIHRTASVPRQLVSVRAGLPAPLVSRIKEILLSMDRSAEGRRVLEACEKTTKFDEIPEGLLRPLLAARAFLDEELGLR